VLQARGLAQSLGNLRRTIDSKTTTTAIKTGPL
jgi:hypothetical protein